MTAKHVAVIGSGIAGLAAAAALSGRCRLTLYEKNAHLGGHAHSVSVMHHGAPCIADAAFMVYNRRNYPRFCRLLEGLGIRGRPTVMSFSVMHEERGLTYNGGSVRGLIADARNLRRREFWRLLADILRFNRLARRAARRSPPPAEQTLQAFIAQHRLSAVFADAYLYPMGASIWSCSPDDFAAAPARFALQFFDNHGLLQLFNRPQWLHIPGGSREYVSALVKQIKDLSCCHSEVTQVQADGAVSAADGSRRRFDAVIIAAHAPQALALLASPAPLAREILGAFHTTQSRAVLHTDTRALPAAPHARAAWNYRVRARGQCITYDLSRLQHLPDAPPLLLTLNPDEADIAPESVKEEFMFAHPLPSAAAEAAKQRRDELHSGGGLLYFCGAYWGSGFHEDGVVSGEAAAARLAADLQLAPAS